MLEQPSFARIQQVFTAHDSSGHTHTEFGPAFRAVPTREPGVLQRLVPEGEDPPSQVITAFAPAEERPSSYPADLPFLPGVETWTTEYPLGEQPPGARWRTSADPAPVVEALVEQSTATGWSPADVAPELSALLPVQQVTLQRDGWARLLITAREDTESVVQLLDLPASLLNSLGSPGA